MSKLNSLSPAFLAAYYRNQCEAVRENIRKGLGIFRGFKVNSGKDNVRDKSPQP